jgi:peptidylprolyl isomerase
MFTMTDSLPAAFMAASTDTLLRATGAAPGQAPVPRTRSPGRCGAVRRSAERLGYAARMDKPEIDFPEGPAPAELVIRDIVVGEGSEAVAGATVEVHYVGVDFESGEEFDSSWNRGESISFPLRGLIQGWQDGIPGMRVGGRRELTIPPRLAYGESGFHRLAGKTLVFVIDLIDVA